MNENKGRTLGDTLGLLLKYEKVTLGAILAVTMLSFQMLIVIRHLFTAFFHKLIQHCIYPFDRNCFFHIKIHAVMEILPAVLTFQQCCQQGRITTAVFLIL